MRTKCSSQRVVSLWNSLPQIMVDVRTLSKFERMDRFLISKCLKGCGEQVNKWS